MDFPKACTSNVHVVENLGLLRFVAYKWEDDVTPRQEQRLQSQEIIARLRGRNVLCSYEQDRVWVFADAVEEQLGDSLSEYTALASYEEGNIEEQPAEQPEEGNPAKDVLLNAIEGAVAFRLATDSASLHVAPWTWLFCSRDDNEADEGSVLMRLHANFTSNGDLYLVPQLANSEWVYSHQAEIGSEIFITPYARLVKQPSDEDESALAIVGEPWRSQVRRALRTQGLQIEPDADWKTVSLTDGSMDEFFEWPSQLCCARPRSNDISRRITANTDWCSWFAGVSSREPFRNPLAVAEEWFIDATARQRATQQGDQSMAPVNGIEEPAGFAAVSASHNGAAATLDTSPAFSQRQFEQQVAMAGIYPTPPDSLTQSQQMAHLNAVATPSVTQIDQGPNGIDPTVTGDDVQSKDDHLEISAEPEAYQMDQEDLFGEVGEMEFGEHEVDDADFNFFDEPDEDLDPASVADTEMLEAPLPEMGDAPGNGETSLLSRPSEDTAGEVHELRPAEFVMNEETEHTAVESIPKAVDHAVGEEHSPTASIPRLEKPLSPFGIRERLLPPPVPASMVQHNAKIDGNRRESSTFSPIAFRESLSLDSKYADAHFAPQSGISLREIQPKQPDISLPSTRKKKRLLKKDDVSDIDDTDDADENESDSYESESSECPEDKFQRIPWDNRKRKRNLDQDSTVSFMWSEKADLGGANFRDEISHTAGSKIIEKCLEPYEDVKLTGHRYRRLLSKDTSRSNNSRLDLTDSVVFSLPLIEDMYDLRKEDLVCIAQVISDTSSTAYDMTASGSLIDNSALSSPPTTLNDTEMLVKNTVLKLFPGSEPWDLSKVALTREPAPRPGTNPGKPAQGQPRPLQRSDSLLLGPDYFSLPPPYVRLQRGADHWEMLPTSLSFWEQLGLGPVSGPKSVRAFCLFPNNDDLQRLVAQFIADLGTAFEGCKLGSHVHVRNVVEKNESDSYEDGMAPVELGDDVSLEAALKAYAAECSALGKTLSTLSDEESDRTIVVYMVNPFPQSSAKQHLCACFWLLFKAYRDHLPKSRRSQRSSDIVLQLLSIDAFASPDGLIVPDAKDLAILAREVYDRCPPSPSARTTENVSPLSILAAPAVELANTAPKRIGFQLTAEPPGDLLHEGSILHLAYATSCDRQWLIAAWIDSTGQNQSTTAFCLRGRSFADVAEDVWERTRDIMAARPVTWRVFILACEELDHATSQCWRSLSYRPRSHPTCVTMLSAQTEPALQLSAPIAAGEQAGGKEVQDVGFLTPVSTPQGNNFTSSPDVGNNLNAPLTPAPSETAASIVENDPDAHLTDVTDETWGVLLSRGLNHLALSTGLANGLLFKRCEGDLSAVDSSLPTGERLPSLGVCLHWTIQVKPGGGVDEGSIRQAELTLRELLKLYRNLVLLTRSKGLDRGDTGLAPLHAAMAMRGAQGLDGMLARVVA